MQYKGQWYQFYHNKSLSGQGNLRSICVDVVNFDADGNILKIIQTTNGPPSIGPAPDAPTNSIKYEAENGTLANGAVVGNDGAASGGQCVQNLHLANSYVELGSVDGGTNGGLATMDIHYATADTHPRLRLTVNGADYSFLNGFSTGGWSGFAGDSTLTIPLAPGKTNIIRLTGGNGGINVDYLMFTPLPPGPWNTQVQNDANFGVQTNQFGFNVIGDNWNFVVEACTQSRSIPFGRRSAPTRSLAASPLSIWLRTELFISAIRNGPITPVVSTASAHRKEPGRFNMQYGCWRYTMPADH